MEKKGEADENEEHHEIDEKNHGNDADVKKEENENGEENVDEDMEDNKKAEINTTIVSNVTDVTPLTNETEIKNTTTNSSSIVVDEGSDVSVNHTISVTKKKRKKKMKTNSTKTYTAKAVDDTITENLTNMTEIQNDASFTNATDNSTRSGTSLLTTTRNRMNETIIVIPESGISASNVTISSTVKVESKMNDNKNSTTNHTSNGNNTKTSSSKSDAHISNEEKFWSIVAPKTNLIDPNTEVISLESNGLTNKTGSLRGSIA